jgi:hypothetical protein
MGYLMKRAILVLLSLLPLNLYAQGAGTPPYRGVNNWNVIFGTDNTYDIGASGATRPRNVYVATGVFTPALTVSGLTATRVPFAGSGGLISDDADLTFDGTRLSATSATVATQLVIPAGTTAATGTLLGNDTDTWIGGVIAGAISLYPNGGEAFRSQSSGNSLFAQPTSIGSAGAPARVILTASNAGTWEFFVATASLTLATGGTTTDTANILPANAIIEAVNYRVTTTITTAVSFSIGDATTADRFVSGATGVAAGSTGVGLRHWRGSVTTDAAGPVQGSAAAVRVTTNANPGAGVIRIQVFYRVFTAPTS